MQPVQVGHREVRDDQGGTPVVKGLQRGDAVGRDAHVVPVSLQPRAQDARDLRLVVNNQDALLLIHDNLFTLTVSLPLQGLVTSPAP